MAKTRTSGYATRRSSLVTAFISDSDYEAKPANGNPQTAMFSIFCGAFAHCHRSGSILGCQSTWNFACAISIRFDPEKRAVGAVGGGQVLFGSGNATVSVQVAETIAAATAGPATAEVNVTPTFTFSF